MYWAIRVLIIKVFYVPMEKYHLTRYQDLQLYKQIWMGALLDYLENNKESITSLQSKSSAAIKSNIHRISKSITSSNDTNLSVTSGLSSASNISYESNSRSFSNGSLVFGIDVNSQKLITSNGTRLPIVIVRRVSSEVNNFLELPSIPKTGEPFEKLLELL